MWNEAHQRRRRIFHCRSRNSNSSTFHSCPLQRQDHTTQSMLAWAKLKKTRLLRSEASRTFTRLSVENISLYYYSKTAQPSSIPFQGRNGYLTNAFFFLLLPVSVIVLLYGQVRRTKHIANSQSSVSRSNVDP